MRLKQVCPNTREVIFLFLTRSKAHFLKLCRVFNIFNIAHNSVLDIAGFLSGYSKVFYEEEVL